MLLFMYNIMGIPLLIPRKKHIINHKNIPK